VREPQNQNPLRNAVLDTSAPPKVDVEAKPLDCPTSTNQVATKANPPVVPSVTKPTSSTSAGQNALAKELKDMKALLAEYKQEREQRRRAYDFDGMIEWLASNEQLKEKPGFEQMERHWEDLKELKMRVAQGFSEHGAEAPVRVLVPGGPGTRPSAFVAWHVGEDSVAVQRPNGSIETYAMNELDPTTLRNIAVSMFREDKTFQGAKALIAAFDREYGLARRVNQKPKDNPFDFGDKPM
jgi:hypothetical protein